MKETLQPILQGEPQETEVGKLEAELSALWRTAGGDPVAESAVTRARAFTLLIFVESEDAAREVSNLVAEVTRQNPCRTIIMTVEPQASPAGLKAWVSAHCHLPIGGEKQVCSEQVTLQARGDNGRELVSVVVPLLVSGLPVHLWWRAGSFSPPSYFDQVLRATNHVIVDSARFPPVGTHLQDLANWIRVFAGRTRVTDLNWSRITPWRELLAQCFDSPNSRPYLERISTVRIEYEMESARLLTQRAQGLLLMGWLASRLGWEFVRSEVRGRGQPRSFHFKSGSRPLLVDRVLKQVEGCGAGVCFSIELTSEKPNSARFLLTRGIDGRAVHTLAEIPGLPPLRRTARLEVLQEVESLNDELMLTARDHVFEETLNLLAQMVGR